MKNQGSLKKGFLEIPNFDYSTRELQELISCPQTSWCDHGALLDKVAATTPKTIKEKFKYNEWSWCGFVSCPPGKKAAPHEDVGYNTSHPQESFHQLERDIQRFSQNKINEGQHSSGRSCAIFFKVQGPFDEVPTVLWTPSKKWIHNCHLESPTLIKTRDSIFHSVNNTSKQDRIIFCLNYYYPITFEKIFHQIIRGELISKSF